jgi:hypothetical protein
MRVHKQLLIVLAVLLLPGSLLSQVIAFQRYMVDRPTAGTLPRGSYSLEMQMYEQGGLLGGVYVGVTPHLMFGVSYGGTNMLGSGDVQWNPQPGIEARARIIDESFVMPAVLVGYNSQGSGAYADSLGRYRNKSLGVFVVASKNFALFHNLGLHGGFNYSFETDDGDKTPNFYVGADLSFAKELRFVLEYDLAVNDNENEATHGTGHGYLNGAVQWLLSANFYLQLNLKDLNRNNSENNLNRELKIGYFEKF